MRSLKVLLPCLLLPLIWNSCTERKPAVSNETAEESPIAIEDTDTDTIADLVEDIPDTKAIDGLFDDFFFNFAGNRQMQLGRIEFPLPVNKDGTVKLLTRNQWKHDYFFMAEGFYTILFDDERQDSLSKKSDILHVTVEKIRMHENLVEQYIFKRINSEWRLTSIEQKRIADHPCASFLYFYDHFVSDTTFQESSLSDFVLMTVPDSDDDFSEMTGSITPEQWPAFKPEVLPKSDFYSVNYGQSRLQQNKKVMIIRGVANGLNVVMDFQRQGNTWKLVRFSI